MREAVLILGVGFVLAGCGRKVDPMPPTPPPTPAKVSVDSAGDTPPPPAPAVAGVPAPEAGAPAEEKPDPKAPPKSVYDDISPEQKILAKKFNRNRDWLVIFKGGTDAQKQQARTAIAALPPAERAEFEKMTKMYSIPYP